MSDGNWPDPARPGVPLNPDRDGWHWLSSRGFSALHWWDADHQLWPQTNRDMTPGLAAHYHHYLGPVLTPQEAAALRARLAEMEAGAMIDFAAIKARAAREIACPKHRYEIGPGPYSMGAKYKCIHCGTEKRMHEIGDYVRGYKAAGGDPLDVCPDWREAKPSHD